MNWWDFVNVLLFLLAQHTVRFFFLSNIIMIFICTVIFIDMFVCVRLLSDMMVVDWMVFLFFIGTILRMVRWKTVLHFFRSCFFFFLREIAFVVVVVLLLFLSARVYYCRVSTY